MTRIYDARVCQLGEGPLWHPIREQLFWFDIPGRKLLSRKGDRPLEWMFDEMVSAAGWISRSDLLIASESSLSRFNVDTGVRATLCTLEEGRPETRSNDGRADPQGGFWIGTMGKKVQPGAGAIYRYFRGELRRLFAGVTIPTSICFAPSGALAYFSDTETQTVMQVELAADGWPASPPRVFLDLTRESLHPDGAVVDARGNFWVAQWGKARVACYDAGGRFVCAVPVGGSQSSCPAFGGVGMTTLFCTTAAIGLSDTQRAETPDAGKLFCAETQCKGQYEHQVILS